MVIKISWMDKLVDRPVLVNIVIAVAGLAFVLGHSILENQVGDIQLPAGIVIGESASNIISIALKELGLASLIAVTLNFSIEAFNRRRHEKEKQDLLAEISNAHETNKKTLIAELDTQHMTQMSAVNKKIFQVVYQRRIPETIFGEVEELLLSSRFVRNSSEYIYTIKEFDQDHVVLDVRHRFIVMNVGDVDHEYINKLGFDVLKSQSNGYSIRSIRVGSSKLNPTDADITKEQRSPRHEWWVAQVGATIRPHEPVECEVSYSRVSPKRGTEVISTRLPTERLVVRVIDPAQAFSFRVSSLHPKAEKNLCENDCPDRIHYHWEIDGTLLPGQGLLFDWVPNEDLH